MPFNVQLPRPIQTLQGRDGTRDVMDLLRLLEKSNQWSPDRLDQWQNQNAANILLQNRNQSGGLGW
jgi:hypothetical protein